MRLSVVIPAYNEEHRLPGTLARTLNFLKAHFFEDYELIVVNDGSTDGTIRIVEEFVKQFPERVSLISYTPNRGRGVAVRTGMKQAQGDCILETDADGSVDEEAIMRFYNVFQNEKNVDVLIGSRNAPGAKILTHQSFLRIFLGYVFIYLARLVFGFKSTDYVLGFKMFTKDAAHDIISYQYDDHYLAEAELAYTAKKRGWRIKEMPVLWTDFKNSRVHPFRDSIRSLVGLGKIIQRASAGLYTNGMIATPANPVISDPRKSLWRRLSIHIFIIITGLMLTTLVSFPQIIFPYLAGDDYQGINIPQFGSDGHGYVARGKEALEGHKLGNLAFREGKETGQDYQFTMNEYVLMAPIKLLGLSDRVNVATVYNIYNFIGVFILILLIYFLTMQLSGNTFVSAAAALFVIGGYSIIYNKTLFYIDLNIYGRPSFPYISSLGLFIYLNLLIKSLRIKQRWYVIWPGLAFGWLFYSYFYAWTFVSALTGILFILYVIARDFNQAKKVFIIAVIGVVLGAYNVIKMLLYFSTTAGKQVSYFVWSTYGHHPIFSKIGFITLLLLVLYIYKRRRQDQNIIIVGAFILAGWIALNQQIFTGRVVQYGHYYWFFIVPLSIIVGFYMLWFLLPWRRLRLALFSVIILIVFLNTAVGQYRSLWVVYSIKLYEQNYMPIIEWLQKTNEPGVILADNDATEYLFVIYTSHDLFWHSVGTIHPTPLQRFKDALFVYGYLDKLSRHNLAPYLTGELIISHESSLIRDLYVNLEGYLSGLEFYSYVGKLAQADPALLEHRAATLEPLSREYAMLAKDPKNIIKVLDSYHVNYIVWDQNKQPEWDLSFLKPYLQEKVVSNNIHLYKLDFSAK